MTRLVKYYLSLAFLAIAASLLLPAACAATPTYTTSGDQIQSNGSDWCGGGVNTEDAYGQNTVSSGYGVAMVREPVWYFSDVSNFLASGSSVPAPGGGTIHSLQDMVTANRAAGYITVLCPFTWLNNGGSGDTFSGDDPDTQSYWSSYLTALADMATQFAGQSDVWIDPWNEPTFSSDSDWNTCVTDMYNAIRGTGNNNIILIPGDNYDSDPSIYVRQASFLSGRSNIVGDVHAYSLCEWEGTPGDPGEYITSFDNARFAGWPLIVGEVGPASGAGLTDADFDATKPFIANTVAMSIPTMAWNWMSSDGLNLQSGGTLTYWGNTFMPYVSQYAAGNGSQLVNLTNGTYNVVGVGSSLYLDDPGGGGANTQTDATSNTGADQQWIFTQLSNGYYEITSAVNGLALTAPTYEQPCELESYTGAADQIWAVTAYGSDYEIVNTASTNNLDYFGNYNGTSNVGLFWGETGNSDLLWTLPQISVSEGPYGGTPAAIPGTVQAENYDTGGQGVGFSITANDGSDNTYRSDPADLELCSDTGGGVDVGWSAQGQWYRYTVDVATAGTYTVGCRVASGASGGTFHIANSGGTNLSGEITVPATGGWQTWTTVDATVTLPAGQQVLEVYQDSTGFNLNYLTFTAAEGPYGGTPAAIPGTVQAENYDTGGQGVGFSITANDGSDNTYRSDPADLEVCTDTGGGVDVGWSAAGQWYRYTVDVASAGTYTVGCRVASGASGGTFQIDNSSGSDLSGTITAPATGGWQTWTTIDASVTLPAGQQVLTVYQDSTGFNLNYLTFSGNSAPSAPTNLTATAGNGQVKLGWTGSSGATSYSVYRGTSSGGEGSTAIASGIATTSYTDNSVTNGTKYYYEVKAVNSSGTSGPSNEASATPTAPSIAFKQVNYTVEGTPQTTVTIPYSSAQTAGDMNVIIVGFANDTSTISSVTDSAGNTYDVAIAPTRISDESQAIYYAPNIKASSSNTVTVTFNTATAYPDIRVLEYSGVSTLDKTAGNTGTASTSSCGPVTTSTAKELIVAGNTIDPGTTGPGSGYTERVITSPDGNIAEDMIVTSTGSYSATAPLSGTGNWVMQMATFR